MSELLTPDLCVIGAGAGGLSVAVGAALMGVPVVLVERGLMGGDCLNAGCVPSKALLAAAHHARAAREAAAFGVVLPEPVVDMARVRAHLREVIGAIAPTDAEARMRALGITVLRAEARFLDARTVEAAYRRVRARRFVIATGSRPAVPPVPGLAALPFLTNETVFDLAVVPERLLVLGAGAVGLELAQAFARLGSAVQVVDAGPALARADPEAREVLLATLAREGVGLRGHARVLRAEGAAGALRLVIEGEGGGEEALEGTHLLVATGRAPSLGALNLAAAGIAHDATGVRVDAGLRTTNRRVYAVGDAAAGSPGLTHAAGYHAGLVLRSALFRIPVRTEHHLIPRVTYTDPEVASVGPSEEEARASHRGVVTLRFPFAENDRARAERRPEGLVKAWVDRRGRVLGAAVVGAGAGELIAPWAMAARLRLPVSAIGDTVMPYPTLSEASKRAATNRLAPALRSPWLGRALRLLRSFG